MSFPHTRPAGHPPRFGHPPHLSAPGVSYFPNRLESKIREFKAQSARHILDEIGRDLLEFAPPADDVSLVLIKKS